MLTVLTNKVELQSTVGVGPQPPLGAVEPGAVVVPPGQVPEGDRDGLAVDPLPVLRVRAVAGGSQPVLAVGIALEGTGIIIDCDFLENYTISLGSKLVVDRLKFAN